MLCISVVANFPVFFLVDFMEHKLAHTSFYVVIARSWEGGMSFVMGKSVTNDLHVTCRYSRVYKVLYACIASARK